jgi:protein SSD1
MVTNIHLVINKEEYQIFHSIFLPAMKEFMFEEFENGNENQQKDPLKFSNESLEIELNRKSQRIQLLSSCFCKSARKSTQKEPFYSPWIKLEESKNAEYKVGILKINKKNRYDAYVRFEDGDDYFIPGMKHMNRALDGDVVICQKLEGYRLEKEMKTILERKQKMSNLIQMRQQKVNINNDDDVGSEFDFEENRTYATVVGVEQLDSRERLYVGTICSSKPGGIQKDSFSDVIWFKPVDVRVPFMLIQKYLIPSEILMDKSELYSCLFTVKILKWVENSIFPLGKYCGKLGLIGQIHTECEAILCSNGIYWEGFDDIVMNDLLEWNGQSLRNDETIDEFSDNWIIPEEEYAKRLDLRNLRVFSIDPPTARDLDDAVSCKKLDDGKFEIGVHIADVSYFVKPDTNLDKEAQKRATSVYLTHKVIPMLPRLLCENLCSLNENVERLAFSVFWTFDEEGNIIGGPTFHKSIIKSCARLWYDHAQAIIDGKEFSSVSDLQICGWSEEDLKEDIITLYHFSKILRQKRFQNGSLTLNSIKLWFKLDEVGNPIQSGIYQIKDSNRLIEEVYFS